MHNIKDPLCLDPTKLWQQFPIIKLQYLTHKKKQYSSTKLMTKIEQKQGLESLQAIFDQCEKNELCYTNQIHTKYHWE